MYQIRSQISMSNAVRDGVNLHPLHARGRIKEVSAWQRCGISSESLGIARSEGIS